MTYDPVGNRLTKTPDTPPSINETTQYSYDDENRLTGVTITQGSLVKQLSFAYDPFGRRIKKTVSPSGGGSGKETTNYVYDGQNIILEYNQAGSISAKYTHGPNIDEPLVVQQGTNTYYYHSDGLGSITGLSNSSGTIVQTYSYDSFGNIAATGSITQPFTYTGREYDSETGMYFYRARYYDPKVGRFVTKDPIGFAGGINYYVYVGNNPVKYLDPLGLAKKQNKFKNPEVPETPNPWENPADRPLIPSGNVCCSEETKKKIYVSCIIDNMIENAGDYAMVFGLMAVPTWAGNGVGAVWAIGLSLQIADKCNNMAQSCSYSR